MALSCSKNVIYIITWNNNILQFNQYMKSNQMSYIIYAD